MSNQNCPCRRTQRSTASCAASAPLCTPLRCAAATQACALAAESVPLRAVAPEEMRMCRHVHPIPVPDCATQSESLCLLRRQNELLAEILAALQTNSTAQA